MSAPRRNSRLAAVMADANVSAKALARAVRELSERQGKAVSCDHTSVSRWLGGTMPRESTAQLIAHMLGSKLGRVLTLTDLGFTGYDDGLIGGVEIGRGDVPGPEAVDRLWSSDLDNRSGMVHSSVVVGAWSDAALTWLVCPEDGGHATVRPQRVGKSDVDAICATVAMFAALDGTYGGDHARRSLIQFLHSGLLPLLKVRRRGGPDRDLYRATAQALLLAAWMTYDAGVHGLAQRYFIQALHFADLADDRLLGANILDAMSHQATFLGKLHAAANLAAAAMTGSRGLSTPSLQAHFATMEARAHAAAGDCKSAEHSLVRAARAFERRDEGSDPTWFDYFDEAELNAELGHCFRDIGRPRDAVLHADQGLSGTSVRSDFFVMLVKAKAYLSRSSSNGVELEAACTTVRDALLSAESVKSARCAAYLRDFRTCIARYAADRAVRDLEEAAAAMPLWAASGASRG